MAGGQQIDSGQGSVAPARIVLLKSRKTGTGATSRALTGVEISATPGSLIGGPGALLVGASAALTQGALGKARATALTGSASNAVAGSVLPPPSATLTIFYSSAEGSAVGPPTVSQYWQSAYATKDGTLIDWGTSDHGHGSDNGVREYDPLTKTQSYVKPRANYDAVIGGKQIVGGNYGSPTQYDNLYYHYIPRIDSWVLPGGAAYNRATGQWTHAFRTEANITDNTAYATGNSLFDGQPLGWKGDKVTDAGPTSLLRPYGAAMLTGPDYVAQYTGDFNPHQAWSTQLDSGARIGGASGGGGYTDRPFMWIIAPSANFGTFAQPYVVFRRDLPASVGGVTPYRVRGRDGACFVGTNLFWVGGDTTVPTAHFFRCDLAHHVHNDATSFTTGAGAIERMPDAPFVATFPLLRHDPFSNALVLWGEGGIAMFDLRTFTWSTITPSAYQAFMGAAMPNGCLGDFINERSGTILRRFYWRAGLGSGWSNGTDSARMTQFHSIKINRPADQVSFLNVQARHPENDAAMFGTAGVGPLRSIKHLGLVVKDDYLYLWSGDWDDHYPSSVSGGGTPGYKIETANGAGFEPNTQNARQEIWRTRISTSRDSGTATWRMVSNAYAAYPWTGSAGYYAGTTKGPIMPDGLGCFTDASGQMWMGPCSPAGYTDLYGSEMAGQETTYAAMFKWTLPGTNSTAVTGAGVNGVALGNGWTLPSQSRLQVASTGTAGADYDAGLESGSGCVGWGRPNKGPAYDPTDNKARVVSVAASGSAPNFTFSINLYSFNCTPDGFGKHIWTRQTVNNIPIQQMGGPGKGIVTGVNTGWGVGGIGNTTQVGRTLYFSLMCAYGVNDSSGNYLPGTRYSGQIIGINLDTFPAASSVSWVPLPEKMNWWLRPWDGPDAASAQAREMFGPTGTLITPGQYRSMVAVGTKLVVGPDRWNKINVDPWIASYDTTTKTWTTFQPAGTHDWPNSLMSFVAVPSLGEVWLCGQATQSDYGLGDASHLAWLASNGMHSPTTITTPGGTGRRIVRFKVDSGETSYSTSFNATENPISESSKWTNGGAVGINWRNVQTTGGIACGASFVTGYDDPIAVLNTSFTANQYAQGTVSRAGGYSPGVSHEIELLLRFQITSGNARGYEVLWGHAGNGAIVRWNGPLGNYTALLDNRPWGAAVDGDVLKAQISGSTITVYKNGVQIDSVTDATYTDGQPGIGFWPQSGSTLTSYGWKDFTAGNL